MEKFLVRQGYAFFILRENGVIKDRIPAGKTVELTSKDQFQQAWKLERINPDCGCPVHEEELVAPENASQSPEVVPENRAISNDTDLVAKKEQVKLSLKKK